MSRVVAARKAKGGTKMVSNTNYVKAKPKGKTFSSKFRGVIRRGPSTWQAQIQVEGNTMYLGRYPSEMEAALVYDTAAKRYHGPLAVLNYDEDGAVSSSTSSSCDEDGREGPGTREASPWREAGSPRTKRHAQHKLKLKKKLSNISTLKRQGRSKNSFFLKSEPVTRPKIAKEPYDIKEITNWVGEWGQMNPSEEHYRQLNAVVHGEVIDDVTAARDALLLQCQEIKDMIEGLESGSTDAISPEVLRHVAECAQPMLVSEVASEEAVSPQCPNKHKCAFLPVVNGPAYPEGEWICDCCEDSFSFGKRWACDKCEYDMCSHCGESSKACTSHANVQHVPPGVESHTVPSSAMEVPENMLPSSMGFIPVGNSIEIKWPENGEWYCGIVADYQREKDLHKIEYFNGEIEYITLAGDKGNGVEWRVASSE